MRELTEQDRRRLRVPPESIGVYVNAHVGMPIDAYLSSLQEILGQVTGDIPVEKVAGSDYEEIETKPYREGFGDRRGTTFITRNGFSLFTEWIIYTIERWFSEHPEEMINEQTIYRGDREKDNRMLMLSFFRQFGSDASGDITPCTNQAYEAVLFKQDSPLITRVYKRLLEQFSRVPE